MEMAKNMSGEVSGPCRETEYGYEYSRLRNDQDNLGNVINRLLDRLTKVMRDPEPCTPECPSDSCVASRAPSSSALAMEIADSSSITSSQINQIQDALNRLEI